MGPAEPSEHKHLATQKVKTSRRMPRRVKILLICAGLLVVAGGAAYSAYYASTRPAASDYDALASAQEQLTVAYGKLSEGVTRVSDSLGSFKSDGSADSFAAEVEKVSNQIDELGKNRAIQADSTLARRYNALRAAATRWRQELNQLVHDMQAMTAATKGLSTDFTTSQASANIHALRIALQKAEYRSPIIKKFMDDVLGIYAKLETKYRDYYAAHPNGSGYDSTLVATSLELLEPVARLANALDAWYKAIDIQDEISALEKDVNAALAQRGIKVKVATTTYCLKNEKLCLPIPRDWKVEATSNNDALTGTRVDNVTFANPDGAVVMRIYESGGSVGGHCDTEAKPIEAKYATPVTTGFEYGSDKAAKVTRLAYSTDGGDTWQWAVAGEGYVFRPDYVYGEESTKPPLYNQKITLKECAASFAGHNAAFIVDAQGVLSEDSIASSASLVIQAGEVSSNVQLKRYKTADEALNDPTLQAVMTAITQATYKK